MRAWPEPSVPATKPTDSTLRFCSAPNFILILFIHLKTWILGKNKRVLNIYGLHPSGVSVASTSHMLPEISFPHLPPAWICSKIGREYRIGMKNVDFLMASPCRTNNINILHQSGEQNKVHQRTAGFLLDLMSSSLIHDLLALSACSSSPVWVMRPYRNFFFTYLPIKEENQIKNKGMHWYLIAILIVICK